MIPAIEIIAMRLIGAPIEIAEPRRLRPQGFTLVEVLITLVVAALFGAAAFATNQRLLLTLKAQRESAAATMMLQERMENLRALSFSNVTDSSYIGSNIINSATTSEAPLSNLSETITVSAYPADGTGSNQWVRDSSHPTGNQASTTSSLGVSHGGLQTVVKADVLITWKSADGRSRTRNLAAVFGIGNLGQ